jgi:hypothetical protein
MFIEIIDEYVQSVEVFELHPGAADTMEGWRAT